jgi:Tol biopolymer transport system component
MSPASAVRAGLPSLTLAALVAASALSQTPPAPAQQQSVAPKDPTYTLPLVPTRVVRFSTDEGTWMSVDISPDGRTLLFDLLGDLYTMPISGGKAANIMRGAALDVQPRFSPDGRKIVFVSDRTGSDHLWIANADGSSPRQVTRGDSVGPSQPVWTPEGEYIVAAPSRGARGGATAGATMWHVNGGQGVRLGPPRVNGITFARDGRWMWYAMNNDTAARAAERGQLGAFQVGVLDRLTGETAVRSNNYGGGIRPIISPDGKWLVYATRHDAKTALRLRDLESGDETWLATDVQHDASYRSSTMGHLPGSAFTPDGKAIVTSYGGKFWRVEVPSGKATLIPFEAEVQQYLGPLAKFEYTISDSFLVRQIRGARPSPDGSRLAFAALNKLYVMDLPPRANAASDGSQNGQGGAEGQARAGLPHRITTTSGVTELSPVWSPDGKYLAWASWEEARGGDIYRIRMDVPNARAERLTTMPALYAKLAYSPDGKRIAYVRGPRRARANLIDEIAATTDVNLDLMWMNADGGEQHRVAMVVDIGNVPNGAQPHFTRDTTRVIFFDSRDGLVSVRFDGTDRRVLLRGTGDATLLSPDGTRAIAVSPNKSVFLLHVPMAGTAPTVNLGSPDGAPVPVRRVTRTGGEFLGWRADGKAFYYSIGRSFFVYDVRQADSLVADSVAKAPPRPAAGEDSAQAAPAAEPVAARTMRAAYSPSRTDVTIWASREKPRGTVALRGARIITMKGREVIENGDVVVRDDRILAVGPRGGVAIPDGAQTIDVSGKTIIPGYVDIHAHVWAPWQVHRTQVPQYAANLAYGVTTTRDPQTSTTDILEYGDLEAVGELIGPRILATGPGIFGSDRVSSLDDARDVMRRYSEHYLTQTIKQYVAGDRRTRQWIVMAAKEMGLTPTTEGAGDWKMTMSEMLDGYAGHEHAIEIWPLYKDAAVLAAQSGITYTPTMLVAYGGPENKNWFFTNESPHDDPKVRRFFYHPELDRRTLRRQVWMREDEYIFKGVATAAAKIVNAGGRVGLGSHGEFQGLGAHWELWQLASGGLTPHQTLEAVTIHGADAIGLAKALGSIERGKLADLQVLNANPLDNLRNTNTIHYVMKNGRLYDGDTLDELWPRKKPFGTPWWAEYDPK